MNCKICGSLMGGDVSKERKALKRCVSCYKEYNRNRRRLLRIKKAGEERICPKCNVKHKSAGYCGEYCSICFKDIETKRKTKWKENNREIDRARIRRYRLRNLDKDKLRCRLYQKLSGTLNRRKAKHDIKKLLVAAYGGKCSICGYNKNAAALTFHHIDPNNKVAGISRMINNHSAEAILEEAEKCMLVCNNCHIETHCPHMAL